MIFQGVVLSQSQMEDFEYSVEICDRDWECFYAECEECNLLPPSLAGVDESGMSDFDETGSILTKIVQESVPTTAFSEVDHPTDGLPESEGSPVDNYLSKYGLGGMESILSGSEEDIHLQSVNVFLERLRNDADPEELTMPSQVRDGKQREAIQEEGHCGGGKQSSTNSWAENRPMLNSVYTKGEVAVAQGVEPVITNSNVKKTKTTDKPCSNIFPESAGINPLLKDNQSALPLAKLFITEEPCAETKINEATQSTQCHYSWNSVDTTSHTNTVMKKMCTTLDDVKQKHLLGSASLERRCSYNSWSNHDMLTYERPVDDVDVAESEATSTNKSASQDSSPSAAVKRKRRKKRRLTEPAESVYAYEKQDFIKPSDSEEEQCAMRAGMGHCVFKDVNLLTNGLLKCVIPSTTEYSTISNWPVKVYPEDIKANDLSYHSPEQEVYKVTESVENNTTDGRTITPLSQTVVVASNNSGDKTTQSMNCSRLQVEKSGVLDKCTFFPVLKTDSSNGESVLNKPAYSERNQVHVQVHVSPQHSNTNTSSAISGESEQPCKVEVKSMYLSVLPSAEFSDCTVKFQQNDKLSALKSPLAEDAGISRKPSNTVHQQLLEPGGDFKDQNGDSLEKTQFSLPEVSTKKSDPGNANPEQLNARTCSLSEISPQVTFVESVLDTQESQPDKCCQSPCLDTSILGQPAEHPEMLQTCSEYRVVSESDTTAELHCHSDITPVSSCCTLDTRSITSLSNESITEMSDCSCIAVSRNDLRSPCDKTLQKKQEEGDGPKSCSVLNDAPDFNCDLVLKAEDSVALIKAECEPELVADSKNSVFAMSSFWSEMEKLTINDILGLRMSSKAVSDRHLPPLQENEQTDEFDLADSGFFNQLDEPKSEQTPDDASSIGNSVEVTSKSADIYANDTILTPVTDTSQPVAPGADQMGLGKISKNVSVQNLPALEVGSHTWKRQTLETLHEEELEKPDHFVGGDISIKDEEVECLASSAEDNYGISLSGIFNFIFGRRESHSRQPATDNISALYTYGNSVPETYDDFFSEFDTENFFYPFINTKDRDKDEPVPVLSCPSSTNRNIQYPEVYDYFFASSSSDESSAESDEEDNHGPVRVVTRFNRTSSTSKFPMDMYDNFFTDKDLKQNFFWKNLFSFRNMSFTASRAKQQTLSNSLVAVTPSARSFQRTFHPIKTLGNQDVMFSDSPLYPFEDRFSRQLAQQHFNYETLQMTPPNPSKSYFTPYSLILSEGLENV